MTELKGLMREIAMRARTYDVTEQAIKVSRRRRLIVRTATPACAAAVAAVVALTIGKPPGLPAASTSPSSSPTRGLGWVTAPVACDLTPLRPPGTYEQVLAGPISPGGRFVGGTVARLSGPETLVMWDNGVPKLLPKTAHDPFFTQIADNGDAVGTFYEKLTDDSVTSFAWRGGAMTILKGQNTEAAAFNSSWQVAGTVDGRPAVWPDPLKEPQILPVPDGMWTGSVKGIDDAGNVLGSVGRRGAVKRDQRMALWSPSGEFRWFPQPPGMEDMLWMLDPIGFGGGEVLFRAIHDTSGETHFIRWNPRTNDYQMTRVFGGPAGQVADNGWQLTWSSGALPTLAGSAAELMLRAPEDARPGSAWQVFMTRDGHTLVNSFHGGEQGHIVAAMWRCR